MVLYTPLRDALTVNGEISFVSRLVSGGVAGGFAIFCFNWAEVLKVQIQASPVPKSMGQVFAEVYSAQGLGGFWAGGRRFAFF
jgi:hypothetical protein